MESSYILASSLKHYSMEQQQSFGPRGNHSQVFMHLKGYLLLSIELVFPFGDGETQPPSFTSKVMKGNLLMCESSLPSIITEIATNILKEGVKSGLQLGIKDLARYSSSALVEHRFTQLLHAVLYANVEFNEVWFGDNDFSKIYYNQSSNANEVVFFDVYQMPTLVEYVKSKTKVTLMTEGIEQEGGDSLFARLELRFSES